MTAENIPALVERLRACVADGVTQSWIMRPLLEEATDALASLTAGEAGFFAGLTPEQKEQALAYRGPEDHPAPPVAPAASDASPSGGRLGLKAMSADIECKRTLKLHFDHEVTDTDRSNLVDAINARTRLLASPPAPAATEMVTLRNALQDLCDAWDDQNGGGKYKGNVTKAQAAARAALAASPAQDAEGAAQSEAGIPATEQNQSLEVMRATCAKNAQVQPAPAAIDRPGVEERTEAARAEYKDMVSRVSRMTDDGKVPPRAAAIRSGEK